MARTGAQDLDDQHGDLLRELAVTHTTAYRLTQALRKRDPTIIITDGVAKQWFKKVCKQKPKHHLAFDFQCLLELVMELLVMCSRSSAIPG